MKNILFKLNYKFNNDLDIIYLKYFLVYFYSINSYSSLNYLAYMELFNIVLTISNHIFLIHFPIGYQVLLFVMFILIYFQINQKYKCICFKLNSM